MADDSYETSSLICLSSLICAFQKAKKIKNIICGAFWDEKKIYLGTAEQRLNWHFLVLYVVSPWKLPVSGW